MDGAQKPDEQKTPEQKKAQAAQDEEREPRVKTAGDLARPGAGSRRSMIRVDEQGVPDIMPARASLIDRQVQQAIREGQFENLPGEGKPLPLEDDTLAGEWALAYHMLKNAGFAPPWIEDDKEARSLLEKRDALLARAAQGRTAPSAQQQKLDRERLVTLVADANKVITRVNFEAPTDRQHRRLLVLADELAKYDEAARR